MNKILVRLYVPTIEQQYDIWIPLNRRIYNVIYLISKAVFELSDEYYNPKEMPRLYDRFTARQYDVNLTVKDANIMNGSELVLL